MTSDPKVHVRGGARDKKKTTSTSSKSSISEFRFSIGLYLDNHWSESIQTWTTVPTRVCFHSMTSDPRVYVRGGARGQNLVHLQKVVFLFSRSPRLDNHL